MMKKPRPGILATRTVNQYRRRDILTYLSLRYYLANSATQNDAWARHAATDMAASRSQLTYFNAYQFKELAADGRTLHRLLHMPGANEALSEAALIAECAKFPNAFGNPDCVFSYDLSSRADRGGIFDSYVKGLKSRQRAIAKAAAKCPEGVVQYVDIKKFYPSISHETALAAWLRCCSKAGLRAEFTALGRKLISDHTRVLRVNENGLLTGPMFSHLLANLVLHELDEDFCENLPVRYLRYVDDIILIGTLSEVSESLEIVASKLLELGFHLHPEGSDKRLCVRTEEWLEGKGDFEDQKQLYSWAGLIGDLKRYLLVQKGNVEELRAQFRAAGFRLPIMDYSALTYEASWAERVRQLAMFKWFRSKTNLISFAFLLEQAHWLRDHHLSDMEILLTKVPTAKGYERKRLIPKLRYTAGRLIYLATNSSLLTLASKLAEIPELYLHGQVMQAIATRNINGLLPLGANAAQAAAQALAAYDEGVECTKKSLTEVEKQTLAILILNGVPFVDGAIGLPETTPLLKIASQGSSLELMKCSDPFLRELACLHGISVEPRHSEMLLTAFDQDDDLILDAIDQLQEYSSI